MQLTGQIEKYISEYSQIYLFGAGRVGKLYLTVFREMFGCTPQAFIVTDSALNKKILMVCRLFHLKHLI